MSHFAYFRPKPPAGPHHTQDPTLRQIITIAGQHQARVFVFDWDGRRLLWVSPRWLGLAVEQLAESRYSSANGWLDLVHPDDQYIAEQWATSATENEPVRLRMPSAADGAWVLLQMTLHELGPFWIAVLRQ